MRAHRLIAGPALAGLALLTPLGCTSSPTAELSTTGTITGTVASSIGGTLAGVSVIAVAQLSAPGIPSLAAVSQSNGQYSIANVPIGTGTVLTTGALPTGCTSAGAPYSMPINPGTITVNITLPCGITTGTIFGSVTSQTGGAIVGASVIVTPSGGKPLAAVTSGTSGGYANDSVPASPPNGTVSVSALPAGCTAGAPVAYSGLTPVGAITVNITVSCQESAATTLGLWVDGQYLLSTTQLTQSGIVAPADSCPGVGFSVNGGGYPTAVGPEAFDASGNLWTQRAQMSGNIIAWTPTQLSATCSTGTPGITLPFTGGAVSALAFDAHGTLWAAVGANASSAIYGFSAAQLAHAATSAVTPAFTIQPAGSGTASSLSSPAGLAFDASGNLWVASAVSVLEYTSAQLGAASTGSANTTPAPSHALSNANALGYAALAFDAPGDLWVTIDASYQSVDLNDSTSVTVIADSIFEYTASQLANLSSNATPTPTSTLGESLGDGTAGFQWGAIAFDGSGNLWLGAGLFNQSGLVYRYPAANLGPGGSGVSDITIQNPSGLVGYGISLAFNPTPTGLPINGSRVARPVRPISARPLPRRYTR
jgi:hypothetical protein